MLNPEIRDQAYQFFIEEAPELLQVIEVGLLTLANERSAAHVHELMRAAHSLKGGAASVELDAIKTLAHRLEDIFKAFYNEAVEIDNSLENLLLEAYDCLKVPLMTQITTGQFDSEAALAKARPIFAQIEAQLGDYLTQAEQYIPSSTDLGIDIVSSLFEVDVAQGLERLAMVIANLQDAEIIGELRAQAEVFAGFAELLNLPGFGLIAQTVLDALKLNPEQAITIAQLALADFHLSREQVLAGDRAQGGSPSVALLALSKAPGIELKDSPTQSESRGESETIAVPSLDDIFGTVATPEVIAPPLDDIFGTVEPNQIRSEEDLKANEFDRVEPDQASSQISATPSIDEVFGLFKSLDKQTDTPSLAGETQEASETLEAVVQSVEQIFETLPPLQELPTASEPSSLPPKTPLSEKSEGNAAPNLSVRVDFNRLERMNNLVGELAINRNSLSLQNEQLQGGVKELLNRFARFGQMTGRLRELSDKLLISPMNSDFRLQNSEFSPQPYLDDFDSLEMDRYGTLYSLLQSLLEEMIQLEESVDDITLFARIANQSLEQQRQMLTNLRDELMWARMLPLGEVLNRFPRILRDLSSNYHKSVRLKLSGTGVLVDKAAVEKLYDPLLHLLRNAFDHGIESPQLRRQSGKAEEGHIEIRAYHQGNQTIIEIKDDGQGLNLDKIGQSALKSGLLTPEQLAVMPKNRLSDLIFEPGFSTAASVSELSGRGIGLDVVRSQLRSLKGTVTVTSSPGQGTTFTLRLPLTLTIAKLLVCLINQAQPSNTTALALPSDSIEEIIMPQAEQIKYSAQARFLHWQRQIIPIYPLTDLLNYNCAFPETFSSKALTTISSPEDWGLPLLLLRRGQQLFALEVNRLVTEQELVIKPFGNAIAPPSYTYGCTILGDGTLIPVINGAILLDQFLETGITSAAVDPWSTYSEEPILNTKATHTSSQTSTILVVDDSAALRRTLALTLQKAGYRVLQARDGREALEQLQQGSTVHLVVCDIEMPNMNGFEFLGQRRLDSQLTQIPVAMLTSRSSEKHRQLAMHLGASAYFTKPYIEQQFLEAIQNILEVGSREQAAGSREQK